jgi:hypothetical protein
MPDVTTVHFSIRYDGPALADHRMDVRELAPALIALSDLLEAANKAAFPDAGEVRVSVNGDFKGGSFGVDLVAVQTVAQQLVAMFAGERATAAANLSGIVGGLGLLGGGLIAVIRWLRGRRPSEIRFEGNATVFVVRAEEVEERMEAELLTGRLYQTRIVRQALVKVLRPLARDGIDVFMSGQDGQVVRRVSSDELPWFEASAAEPDVVADSVLHKVLLQVESPVFKDGNKWRVHDGDKPFYVVIADEAFRARVDAGLERFGKGDILLVDLRRVQLLTDAGLRTEWEVLRVLEHRAPLQQPIAG